MARKCKCHFCKKEGTTDTLFKVVNEKGLNTYYCNEGEYNQEFQIKLKKDEQNLKRKELLKFVAEEVLKYEDGQIVPPLMVKRIDKLIEFYAHEVVQECFKVCNQDIQYWMFNKNFTNEFGMVSYIMKIIESNINDVYNKWRHEQVQNKRQEISSMDLLINNLETTPVKKSNNGILDFLDEEDV